MKKRKFFFLIIFITLFVFISGCATQSVMTVDDPPGFFSGLLHGFIMLFSLIASLFTDCSIYAFPNTGFWYNLGFVIGASAFFGGGGARASKKN
jgi:hypothetical protein